MFAKLLKNEFRSVKKALWPLTIASLLASAIGYVLLLIGTTTLKSNNHALLDIIMSLFPMSILLLLIIYMIGSNIYLYVHFYKSKFTDEGYLTFTLPATTHQILLSSILNMIIWSFIITITTFFSLFLMLTPLLVYLNDGFNLFQNISILLDSAEPSPLYVFYMILNGISSFCYALILPILSITIGSVISSKHKLLVAFGVGYGINMGYNIITTILTLTEVMAAVPSDAPPSVNVSMIILSIVTIIASAFGYFIMHNLIEKKLNL